MASRYRSSLSLSAWECCCSRRGPRPRKPSPWRSPRSPAGQGREGGGRAGDGDLPDRRRGAGGGPVCESGPEPGRVYVLPAHLQGQPTHLHGAGLGGQVPVRRWPGTGQCYVVISGPQPHSPDRHAPAPLTGERCSILCAAPLPAASRGGPNDRWRRMEIRSL
jgi:hypothetical protein